MAKHRFQRTRRIQATRLLLLAALVLGLGVSPGWAGQQSPKSPCQAPRPRRQPGRRRQRPPRQNLPRPQPNARARRQAPTVPRWRRGNGTLSSSLRLLSGKGGGREHYGIRAGRGFAARGSGLAHLAVEARGCRAGANRQQNDRRGHQRNQKGLFPDMRTSRCTTA